MLKSITLTLIVSALTGFSYSHAQQDVEKIPLEKMAKFETLLGNWQTKNYEYQDNEWKQIATSTATFSKKLKGKMITEEISNLEPNTSFIVETLISFDQYRDIYRLAAIDDTYGLMDIYEGDFIEDGVIQFTNFRSGTNFPTGDGGEMYFRLTLSEINNDTRELLVENTIDHGKTWTPMNKNIFKKIN